MPVFFDGSELTPNMKYRITYRFSGQKKDREAILRFLGGGDEYLSFHGRPLIGTAIFNRRDILRLDPEPLYPAVYIDKVKK